MEVQIVQVNRNTWRIEEEGVRFFLLTGSEKALLIDSGMQVHNAKDIAQRLTDLPLSLLNTHADMDHIGSNEQFEAFYMHPAEEPNYRKYGRAGRIIPVVDGNELDLGGRILKIIHLPGHTAGSIAVLDTASRVLICGDPIQMHGKIFMFGQHRDMRTYIASLRRLAGMTDLFDELWPSHADIPVSPEIIGRLADDAGDVLARKVHGIPDLFHGTGILEYDLGYTVLLCDP